MIPTYPTMFAGVIVNLPACCLNCTFHFEDEYGDAFCTNNDFEPIKSPWCHSCADHSPK